MTTDISVQQTAPTQETISAQWRMATAFSKSQFTPGTFRGKPEDCFVAIQMAGRIGCDPILMMQQTYFIQGKPGIQSQFAIALANEKGPFAGPIQFELSGEGNSRKAVAHAKVRATGDRVEASVSMEMAQAEGWTKKAGSKWRTLPDQMLQYRAAMFLIKLYCPQVLFGMQSAEELVDISSPNPQRTSIEDVAQKFSETGEIVEPEGHSYG